MKKIILICTIILISIGIVYQLNIKNKVVAKVNGNSVKEDVLNEYLLKQYGTRATKELVNRELIKAEASKRNLTASTKELEAEAKKIKKYNDPTTHFNIEENKDYLEEKVLAKKLIKEDLDINQIKEEYKNQEITSPNIYEISTYEVESKDKANEIYALYEKDPLKAKELLQSLSKIDTKYYEDEDVLYNFPVADLDKMNLYQVPGTEANMFIFVEDIVSNDLDVDKDIDKIVDRYLSKSYGREYAKLLQKLNKEHKVIINNITQGD